MHLQLILAKKFISVAVASAVVPAILQVAGDVASAVVAALVADDDVAVVNLVVAGNVAPSVVDVSFASVTVSSVFVAVVARSLFGFMHLYVGPFPCSITDPFIRWTDNLF